MPAWKGTWPLGRGFERYYGFLGGETNQWYPDLIYDNHPVDPPYPPTEGYHFSKDLTDRGIEFSATPSRSRPTSPGSCTSRPARATRRTTCARVVGPVQGQFEHGYEANRPEILAAQKRMGLLPRRRRAVADQPARRARRDRPDGEPWPPLDVVRPWESLSEDEQRLFARMAEVYAGFVSYTDHELGRLIDYLEESGQLDNTIVVVVSDNGASGEGGPNGSVNENKFFNGVVDDIEENLRRIDEIGTRALLQPLLHRLGVGVRHAVPVLEALRRLRGRHRRHVHRRPGPPGSRRTAPPATSTSTPSTSCRRSTSCSRSDPPDVLKGFTQNPIEGESFAAVLSDDGAPGRKTQFFSMLGQRAIYDDGWLANTMHPPLSGWGHFEADKWELYHLAEDRTQLHDLADQEPERLERLKGLWFYWAGKLNGLPLDDRTAREQLGKERPQPAAPRDRYVYYPDTSEVPEAVAVNIRRRSFTVAAAVDLAEGAEGALFVQGGVGGGHALYIQDGRLHYVYNWLGDKRQEVSRRRRPPAGSPRPLRGVRQDRRRRGDLQRHRHADAVRR